MLISARPLLPCERLARSTFVVQRPALPLSAENTKEETQAFPSSHNTGKACHLMEGLQLLVKGRSSVAVPVECVQHFSAAYTLVEKALGRLQELRSTPWEDMTSADASMADAIHEAAEHVRGALPASGCTA